MVHDGACKALRLAQVWRRELDAGGVNRADIARRELVSRARVTQILAMLELGPDVQKDLLDGTSQWSVRKALRQVGRHYH